MSTAPYYEREHYNAQHLMPAMNIAGTTYNKCYFKDQDFSGANLFRIVFSNCTFKNCKFTDTTLFQECTFHLGKFCTGDYSEADFRKCKFSSVEFEPNVKLPQRTLYKCVWDIDERRRKTAIVQGKIRIKGKTLIVETTTHGARNDVIGKDYLRTSRVHILKSDLPDFPEGKVIIADKYRSRAHVWVDAGITVFSMYDDDLPFDSINDTTYTLVDFVPVAHKPSKYTPVKRMTETERNQIIYKALQAFIKSQIARRRPYMAGDAAEAMRFVKEEFKNEKASSLD